MPLIFLSAFFDRFPAENSRVDRLAAKWLWLGSITGVHENTTDTYINRLVKQATQSVLPDEAFAQLIADLLDVPRRNQPLVELDRLVSMNRATGKIFILGLLAAKPSLPAIATRRASQVQSLFEFEDSDSDQQSSEVTQLEKEENELTTLLLPLANAGKLGSDVVVHVPGISVDMLLRSDASTDLESHVLDTDCIGLLRMGDVAGFRQHRKILLKEHLDRFMSDRVGDSNDHRPSIRAILEHGKTQNPVVK
jgi:hypothetical protein